VVRRKGNGMLLGDLTNKGAPSPQLSLVLLEI
jgi:hypothetical protein